MPNPLPPSITAIAMVAMFMVAPACMAQARDGMEPAPAAQQEAPPQSAFGRVMGVMIQALQQQAERDASAASPEVPTTAGGTPLDIEVGGAFRLEPAAHAQATTQSPPQLVSSEPPARPEWPR